MKDYKILFVDDDKVILDMVERFLTREGYTGIFVNSGLEALERLKEEQFDIVFTDFKMPEVDGIELLSAIKEYHPDTEVIIVTGHGTMEMAIKAMKIGSYDYIQKPFKLAILKLIIDRIIEEKKLKHENVMLKTRVKERHRYEELIGINLRMQEIYEIIDRMKNRSPNVLIQGESGSGKALTAGVIHRSSDRADQPLININCRSDFSDIPDEDISAQLKEMFQTAEGATLYLDEITDIPLAIQDELPRALKQMQGDDYDIRLIAATNKDLRDVIESDLVRKPFLALVNAVDVNMPPLRDRKEDISLLIHHFLNKFNTSSTKKIYCVSPGALDYLLRYRWPGNVIQLENVIERAFALGAETSIAVDDLPGEIKTFGDITIKC